MQFVEYDLAARGFGLPWGHQRSYANLLSDNAVGINGNSWLVPQLKSLRFVDVVYGDNDPEKICLILGANSSRWFERDEEAEGVYRAKFSGYDTLTHHPEEAEFVWTEASGQQTIFFDNSEENPPVLAGRLKALTDQARRVVELTYDEDGRLAEIEQEVDGQANAFTYEYQPGSGVPGVLSGVGLWVNDRPVRRARYRHYEGGDGGSARDLRSAVIEQYTVATASWERIERRHYRYYVVGEENGFVHGLKLAIRGTAYQRMIEAGLDPETAPEAELRNFADFYFEYDEERRVTREETEGGRKVYMLGYEPNPEAPDFADVNTWAMRTVEVLPDGNENRVYSNKAGQTILKIVKETATGREWYDYKEYDAWYHMVLQASSAAVDSVTEPALPGSTVLTVTLKAVEGMIREQVFYAATDLSSGAVEGRLKEVTVKKGTGGTSIKLRKVEYEAHEAFGETIYPLRAQEVYPEETTANAARTTYDYTWYEDGGEPTFQTREQTTTAPIVPVEQNGSGVAGEESQVFDELGRLRWLKDARGAISYREYDLATGALVQTIQDVDTTRMVDVPEGWHTVLGWGLHLVTDYGTDSQGRQVLTLGPWHEVQLQEKDTVATSIRRVEYTSYLDEAHEVRTATGYMTGGGETTAFFVVGAVRITRNDDSGRVTDEIQAVRTCNCGPLTATETFPRETWSRWTHSIYDTWGRLNSRRVYHRIPLDGEGESGSDYLETISGYDVMGRQNRVVEPSGTIRRIVYDTRSQAVSNWKGTEDRGATDEDPTGNDTAGNNMRLVSTQEYDDGHAGGDGNLTKVTKLVDANDTNDRVTSYGYDYRNRKNRTTQTDGTIPQIERVIFDNLERPVQSTTYRDSVNDENRIRQNRTFYDKRGRIYRQETDGVDSADGAIVGTLTSQYWYDLSSNLIKAASAGRTSFIITVYDALNRPTLIYEACVPGVVGVPVGNNNDVSNDTVLEQSEIIYDHGGNVIQKNLRRRFHDAAGKGALQDATDEPKARVTSTATWSDPIGRIRVTADYGTNGGVALERPAVVPPRSAAVLVTTNRYKDDGDANATIDPMGLETRWENDQAGRRVRLIENYVPECPEQSRVSEYAWHASGQLERLTLLNNVTGDQVTWWVFGVTLLDSEIADNNLVRAKIYPESDDRPAPLNAGPDAVYSRLEYAYNRQGQAVQFTDADGTVHTYTYDTLGRLTEDAVPTLGPGLDGTVRRIERGFEVRGMLNRVTSYDGASGGNVFNEVIMAYDAFGNLVQDRQSHSGAVNQDTPEVGYSYADGSTNTARRTAITYPNGQVMNTAYGTANSVDDHFNRVTALQLEGEGETLVEYSYVGVAWQIRVGYAGPAVELTYLKQGDEPVGDAGDPYNGYDRFGRTVDMRWQKTTSGHEQLDRIQYGFDRDSRRTWRKCLLTTGQDTAYEYDGLNQVTQAGLGNVNLNGTAIGGIPTSLEQWKYDSTGNWQNYRIEEDGAITLNQRRVHDKGNRLTRVEGNPHPVLVDRVGRMCQVPPDAEGDWDTARVLVWDAWSRLVELRQTVDDGGETISSYAYDGLTRRTTRVVSGVTWHSYYSDGWRPLEVRRDSQTTSALHYYWGARHRDELVRRDRATVSGGELDETRYILQDYFSPASITDENGVVTERYRFSAFGIRTIMDSEWSSITSSECDFQPAFQGQLLDPETAMLNYGYRYYSTSLGRWLSKDPIDSIPQADSYLFVGNAPTNKYDLYGLIIVILPCGIVQLAYCGGECVLRGAFCYVCYQEFNYLGGGRLQYQLVCRCAAII